MNELDALKLENQLCFLLYASSRELTKKYKPLLEELDVTYPQYLVLLLLWEHRSLSVKEMGNYLYLDSGTLTPMLKRMEQQQLIQRKRSLEDERSVLITLTEKGTSLQQKAECIPTEITKLFGKTPEEVNKLKQALLKLLQNLT
ncbi:MarR family transcriptional regulator [Cytobacillus oceanisediminis]|uniref:MarR family transcriptional regulator n=2 Tax=Niallia TaxID=2837506 RepID=A0A941JIA9_NIACI|nr:MULTISPECIES: MarR family transcriptional regulator [Bacillaceae]EOR21529.1 transcriptional regulator sensing organic peroxides [Niallia nealsonii AAU1]MDU1847360.1 MarR family transcriptional regulator [Niallia nealsonii]MBZ9534541.1 MarR family transcriptional regulator [Cytobacillus oceanisediminis]MCB5239874.1 MarR family transcriptional regulator [Niallia circulans]MED3795374.1 MarR family transcriptional regulator [Niallia alba]